MQGLDGVVRVDLLHQRFEQQQEEPLQEDKPVLEPQGAHEIEDRTVQQLVLQSLGAQFDQSSGDVSAGKGCDISDSEIGSYEDGQQGGQGQHHEGQDCKGDQAACLELKLRHITISSLYRRWGLLGKEAVRHRDEQGKEEGEGSKE